MSFTKFFVVAYKNLYAHTHIHPEADKICHYAFYNRRKWRIFLDKVFLILTQTHTHTYTHIKTRIFYFSSYSHFFAFVVAAMLLAGMNVMTFCQRSVKVDIFSEYLRKSSCKYFYKTPTQTNDQ